MEIRIECRFTIDESLNHIHIQAVGKPANRHYGMALNSDHITANNLALCLQYKDHFKVMSLSSSSYRYVPAVLVVDEQGNTALDLEGRLHYFTPYPDALPLVQFLRDNVAHLILQLKVNTEE